MLREKLITHLQRIDPPIKSFEFIYLTIIIFACVSGIVALGLLFVILFASKPLIMTFITFVFVVVLYWIWGVFKEIQRRQQ